MRDQRQTWNDEVKTAIEMLGKMGEGTKNIRRQNKLVIFESEDHET